MGTSNRYTNIIIIVIIIVIIIIIIIITGPYPGGGGGGGGGGCSKGLDKPLFWPGQGRSGVSAKAL